MKKIVSIVACTLLLFSCGGNKKENKTEEAATTQPTTEAAQFEDEHSARNSLSYYGVYEGTLPCADCEGIKTKLTLNKDNTYNYEQEYLTTKTKDTKSSFTGKFVWDEKGEQIKLEGMEGNGSSNFFVAESKLLILDQEGNRIEGELAEHYVLNQTQVTE